MNNADDLITPITRNCPACQCTHHETKFTGGLTKREHFAAMAMQGLASNSDDGGEWSHDAETCAVVAVKYADALLAALSQSGE